MPLTGHNGLVPPARDHNPSQVYRLQGAGLRQVPLLGTIVGWQKDFQNRCISLLRRLKTDPSVVQVVLLLTIALGYGAVHALGPGHGKLVLGACVIGNRYTLKDALQASLVFSLVHNGIPVIIYVVFLAVLGILRFHHTHLLTAYLYRVSGMLLTVLGIALLASLLIKKQSPAQNRYQHRLKHLSLPLACAAAGLVPCPGTLLILFFAGTMGMPLTGFAMAGAFFTGMLVTLSVFALLVTSSRNFAVVQTKLSPLINILRIIGPVFLILIGLYMAAL